MSENAEHIGAVVRRGVPTKGVPPDHEAGPSGGDGARTRSRRMPRAAASSRS